MSVATLTCYACLYRVPIGPLNKINAFIWELNGLVDIYAKKKCTPTVVDHSKPLLVLAVCDKKKDFDRSNLILL